MADALKCDRCSIYYEKTDEDTESELKLMEGETELDLCKACGEDHKDWLTNEKRFPKGKKRYGKRGPYKRRKPVSDEEKKAKSERMTVVQKVAAVFIKEEGLNRPEALKKAHQEVREKGVDHYHHPNFTKIPEGEDGRTYKDLTGKNKTYRCVMCRKGKLDGPHQMCPKCEEKFPDGKKE